MAGKFRSGYWEGTITMQGKQNKLELQLAFTDDRVEGAGTAQSGGHFTIEGTYSTKPPYGCDLSITFSTSKQKLDLSGWRESEKGGIFGTYKSVGHGSGNFNFTPAKLPESLPPQKPASNNNNMIQELEAMGFPTWICKQALDIAQDLEAAVEVCFTLMQSGEGEQSNTQGDSAQEGHAQLGAAQVANAQGAVTQEKDEQLLERLMEFGFSHEQAKFAASQTSNVDEALEMLFSQK